jgi:hypothetical protein
MEPPIREFLDSTFSKRTSYTSLPPSSLSLDIKGDAENDGEIDFPSYENPAPTVQDEGKRVAAPIPEDGPLKGTCRPRDDQALEWEPTRHVDYLAHEWKLEDIWSSRRYVVARRKVYSNSDRLENAAWRTWAKAKDNLRTVTPESLNW